MRTEVIAGLLIVFLLIGLGVGYGIWGAAPVPVAVGLSGDQTIVALLPLTGALTTYGENSKCAAELAASEVNAWLEDRDAPWRLKLVVDDTATDGPTALSKLKAWHGKGVSLFAGPMGSFSCKECKEYCDANHVLIASPSSTSPALSISDDYIYRFCPDDTVQGDALARLLWEAGVRHVVFTYIGNEWGDMLSACTGDAFKEMGGKVYEKYVRYTPGAVDFPTEAGLLSDYVSALIAEGVPKEEIGVQVSAYDDVVPYMEDAAAHPVLKEVKWFGCDGTCLLTVVTEHPDAGPFATDTKFCSTIYHTLVSPKFKDVKEYVEKTLGRTPDTYAYSTYDVVWCLALTLDILDAYDSVKVWETLPKVVEKYFGAAGYFTFNENGDRGFADYDLWTVALEEGTCVWKKAGIWRGGVDEIEWAFPIYG